MSKALQVIQLCNHSIKSTDYTNGSDVVTKTADSYDVINSSAIISRISRVYDASYEYMDGVDFRLYSHNSIEWLNPSTDPTTAATYTVEYVAVQTVIANYDSSDCPRCRGRGWFIDVLNSLGTKMKSAENIYKLAQDVVMTLLTENINGYGTDLPSVIGSTTLSEADKLNIVTSSVRDAETQVKEKQAELTKGGVVLPDDEKLSSITLLSVSVSEPTEIIAELYILSVSGKNAELALAI